MLLDVIIGVLILCLGVAVLGEMSLAAQRATLLSRYKSQAANLAKSELEDLKALGMATALQTGRVEPGQTVCRVSRQDLQLTVSGTQLSGNLLQVEVDAEWWVASEHGNVSLCTLLSAN